MSFLVLPLDGDLLERVERDAAERGWTLDVSRGEEQVIVCVGQGGEAAALAAALPRGSEVDVVEIGTREQYARRRARRRFLAWLARALTVLVFVGWAIPILGFLEPPRQPLATPSLVRVATAREVQPNSAVRVRFGDHQVLLIHLREGQYFALGGRCTFAESCQLAWDPDLRRIVCPCHGCQFDVYGNVLKGPPTIPLASYRVEEIGDHLYLRRD